MLEIGVPLARWPQAGNLECDEHQQAQAPDSRFSKNITLGAVNADFHLAVE